MTGEKSSIPDVKKKKGIKTAGLVKHRPNRPLASTREIEKGVQQTQKNNHSILFSEPGGFLGLYFGNKGNISVSRVSSRLGLTRQQLAETLGVTSAALRKDKATLGRTTEMVEILYRIRDWAGSDQQAVAWYRAEPIPAFGGRTAESLVKEGRATAVRDYLDHIATGGFA